MGDPLKELYDMESWATRGGKAIVQIIGVPELEKSCGMNCFVFESVCRPGVSNEIGHLSPGPVISSLDLF